MVGMASQKMLCSGYTPLREGMSKLVEDVNVCKVRAEDYAAELPSGAWSSDATACYLVSQKVYAMINSGAVPNSWGCGRIPITPEAMYEDCRRL